MEYDGPGALIVYLLPQAVSAILIVYQCILVPCYCSVKKKVSKQLKLSGRDEHKITKLQRLIHNLQMQLESSLPVFVLGGIDGLLNLLRIVLFIVITVFFPFPLDLVLSLVYIPMSSLPNH